jgi:DNA gyrase subunit B
MGHGGEDITVLSGLEAMRRRPEMYVGAMDSDEAMNRLVEQVLCGSLDDAVSGRCRHIAVSLHADGTVTVADDGAGMSMERDQQGVPLAERLMTQLHACRAARQNADIGKRYCGLGIAVVNALSESCRLEIRRDGRIWTQEYRDGTPLAPFHDVGPAAATGTRLWFKPDPKLLPRRINAAELRRCLVEIGREVPEAEIILTIEPPAVA